MEKAILQASRARIDPLACATVTALKELEWRRFETAVAAYFEARGLRIEQSNVGRDGGVDVFLYEQGAVEPIALVQCKTRTSKPVGAGVGRELVGVLAMKRHQGGEVYIVTTDGFTPDAWSEARKSMRPIHLWSGEIFADAVNKLPKPTVQDWLKHAFSGDFHTPTCVKCGLKLTVDTEDRNGPRWHCTRTARCDGAMFMRKEDREVVKSRLRARETVPPAPSSANREVFPSPVSFPTSLDVPVRPVPVRPPPRGAFVPTRPLPKSRPQRPQHRLRLGRLLFGLVMIAALLVVPQRLANWATQQMRPRPSPTSSPAPVLAKPPVRANPTTIPQTRATSSDPTPAAPISQLVRYKRPRAIFHLTIETQVNARDEQLRAAAAVAETELRTFAPDARPSYLAIATEVPSNYASLGGYLVFDVQSGSFVSRNIIIAPAQPYRTIAIVGRYECYFVGMNVRL